MTLYYRTILVTLCILKFINSSKAADNVRIFTVATEANDGYERYIRSAKYYGLQVQTLGLGKEWKGGDMRGHGGGFKVNLLKEAVEPYKDDENTIIIFTDSYDVVFTSNLDDILSKFRKFDAKILFGAEHYCWPDESLKSMYPTVTAKSARYLNSGLFMGYASSIYDLLKTPISDADDDQLYYTQAYLDNDLRNNLGIQLDHKSEIFQNLHGARADVKLDVDTSTGQGSLQNLNFMTHPSVIHGNGLSKIYLNAFSNYLAGNFEDQKCQLCEDTKIEIDENKLPIVSLSLFVIKPMPFFEEFLDRILELKYPRKSINLFLYCNVPYHEELVNKFISNHGDDYKTIKTVLSSQKIEEAEARGLSAQQAQQKKSDYLFSVDAEAHLDNPEVLRDLIKFNKSFIAPVLVRPSEMWSNFWGALSESGYYARSHDYVDIVKNNIRGMWNMPYVSTVYLAKSSILEKFNFNHETYDPDMVLCAHLRDKGVFMYVVNLEYYGHLVNNDDFNPSNTRPDFYMLFSNPSDWQRRYIHPEYIELLKPNVTFQQPCTDVYWFPIGTERFCKDLIAIMEAFGKWSDGSNNDKRLEGGYEAVPTRDIHMNQVGLDAMWLHFLKVYVRPLQETVYTGYYHNPPRSLMNFVVRYRIDEQPYLRPHHDSSTYTINIALNRAGIDYEGGGCRFIRYNCSVTDTKMGWMLMHPGRLTHFHEGLKTLSGTRYIMISFVDP